MGPHSGRKRRVVLRSGWPGMVFRRETPEVARSARRPQGGAQTTLSVPCTCGRRQCQQYTFSASTRVGIRLLTNRDPPFGVHALVARRRRCPFCAVPYAASGTTRLGLRRRIWLETPHGLANSLRYHDEVI